MFCWKQKRRRNQEKESVRWPADPDFVHVCEKSGSALNMIITMTIKGEKAVHGEAAVESSLLLYQKERNALSLLPVFPLFLFSQNEGKRLEPEGKGRQLHCRLHQRHEKNRLSSPGPSIRRRGFDIRVAAFCPENQKLKV